jgi:hypothetical protein
VCGRRRLPQELTGQHRRTSRLSRRAPQAHACRPSLSCCCHPRREGRSLGLAFGCQAGGRCRCPGCQLTTTAAHQEPCTLLRGAPTNNAQLHPGWPTLAIPAATSNGWLGGHTCQAAAPHLAAATSLQPRVLGAPPSTGVQFCGTRSCRPCTYCCLTSGGRCAGAGIPPAAAPPTCVVQVHVQAHSCTRCTHAGRPASHLLEADIRFEPRAAPTNVQNRQKKKTVHRVESVRSRVNGAGQFLEQVPRACARGICGRRSKAQLCWAAPVCCLFGPAAFSVVV